MPQRTQKKKTKLTRKKTEPIEKETATRFFMGAAVILVLFMWIVTAFLYPSLPGVIATHYNVYGQADGFATKSIVVVFVLPLIQTLLTALFFFIYAHPQYMHIPSSFLLALLPEAPRQHVYAIFRKTIAAMTVLINVLFSYIGMATLSAEQNTAVLNSWVLFGLIGLMLFIAILYSFSALHIVRAVVKQKRAAK